MSEQERLAQSRLKKDVIQMSFSDASALRQAYMPFIVGCGIFYATDAVYEMGQDVFVFIKLPNSQEKFAISGRVVWLNPIKKAVNRLPGVGVQLRGREVEKVRAAIEQCLGKIRSSYLPTATI